MISLTLGNHQTGGVILPHGDSEETYIIRGNETLKKEELEREELWHNFKSLYVLHMRHIDLTGQL